METIFSPEQIDSKSSKASQVYELLRNAIISLKMPPECILVEKDICSQLGISRTPLREAIIQLAKENLIKINPSDATYVTKINLSEVIQGQLVRDTLEMRITRLAARNFKPDFEREFELELFKQRAAAERKEADEFFALDNDFHKLISRCAGFGEIWQTIHYATGQLDRVRRLAFALEEQYFTVLEEHENMYRFLRSKHEDGVSEMFQIQLDSTFPSIEIIKKHRPELVSLGTEFDISDIR